MNALKLAFLWLQIYSLNIHVAGCMECAKCVSDVEYLNNVYDSLRKSKREIHRLKGIQRELFLKSNKWRFVI